MTSPLHLVLGGKGYEVRPLPILKARAWRQKLIAAAREIAQVMLPATNGHDEVFFSGLGSAFVDFPDKIAELVFAYAPELPRDEILAGGATDEELVVAFSLIMKAGFPFLHHLSLMLAFEIASMIDGVTAAKLEESMAKESGLTGEELSRLQEQVRP